MKIKRGHIFASLSLAIALGATFSVYQFYVKERLRELAEHEQRKEDLMAKIKVLKDQFAGTKPTVVLTEWASLAQPWEETVLSRAGYFNLAELPLEVTVPENERPRFYYAEVYPQKLQELREYARRGGTQLNVDFGVRTDAQISGTNPTAAEVSEWLTRIEYYTFIAKLLIDNNAGIVHNIALWPPRQLPAVGLSGTIELRTAGLNFEMTMRDFASFFDKLKQERRYFTVDHFWIHNQTLRNANAPIKIQMLLTQGRFVPRQDGGGAASPEINAQAAFTPSAFGSGPGSFAASIGGAFGGENSFLAQQAAQKPSLMRKILSWFPF